MKSYLTQQANTNTLLVLQVRNTMKTSSTQQTNTNTHLVLQVRNTMKTLGLLECV